MANPSTAVYATVIILVAHMEKINSFRYMYLYYRCKTDFFENLFFNREETNHETEKCPIVKPFRFFTPMRSSFRTSIPYIVNIFKINKTFLLFSLLS